jgi:hypothetical protein
MDSIDTMLCSNDEMIGMQINGQSRRLWFSLGKRQMQRETIEREFQAIEVWHLWMEQQAIAPERQQCSR